MRLPRLGMAGSNGEVILVDSAALNRDLGLRWTDDAVDVGEKREESRVSRGRRHGKQAGDQPCDRRQLPISLNIPSRLPHHHTTFDAPNHSAVI